MHPDAPYAARAAIAAGNQGKFWEMHDKLFEANISRAPNGLKPDKIERMASDLGLDVAKFKADVGHASEAGDIIASDQAQASALAAYGTPTFFINGVKIAGAAPFETFKAGIDSHIMSATPDHAAKAAMAAAKQGKFWQMHERMFANQKDLSEAKYEEWAGEIGVDVARWKADKDSQAIAEAIQRDNNYGQQVGANGTPSFFINGKLIAGALPFDSFKTVIDEQIAKANELTKKGVRADKLYEAIVAENVKTAGSAPEAKVEVGNAPAIGPKNAPVTIVEWSDFQCPYCGKVEPTLQQLREEYNGKIRLAWKNQPLSFHPNAMPAAEAAMAAGEQGKFWEFHDALFKQQNKLGPELYDEVAKEIGLDMSRFHASIEAHSHAAQIKADMAAGSALGADGTPTFFINGKKLVGALPVDSFRQVIDAELAAQVAKK